MSLWIQTLKAQLEPQVAAGKLVGKLALTDQDVMTLRSEVLRDAVLGSMRSAEGAGAPSLPSGLSPSELLRMLKQNVGQQEAVDVSSRVDSAVSAVAFAVREFKFDALDDALESLRRALDPITKRAVFVIGADGSNGGPDAPTFALLPSEAVFLNLLSGAAEAGSRSQATVSGRRRAAAMWRAIDQATRTVVLGTAWSVEANDLLLNSKTPSMEAQARQLGLKALLPLVEQWAARALAPTPTIEMAEGHRVGLGEFRKRWPDAAPQALPLEPRSVDDAHPLRSTFSSAEVTLDRFAGTITIEGRRTSVLRFDRLVDAMDGAERRHQDGQIRLLDDVIARHFQSGDQVDVLDLPSEISLVKHEMRAGDRILARNVEGAWVLDAAQLREARTRIDRGTPGGQGTTSPDRLPTGADRPAIDAGTPTQGPGASVRRRLFPVLHAKWSQAGDAPTGQTPRAGLIYKWSLALQSLGLQEMAGKIRLTSDDRTTLQREVLKYTVMGTMKVPEGAGAMHFPQGQSEAELRTKLAENIGQDSADRVFSLIEDAVIDVVDAIEQSDFVALYSAREKLGRALDPITERFVFDAGADGWNNTADAPTFRLFASEAIFLNLLSGGAEAAGRLPPTVKGRRRAAAGWRAIEQATRAMVGKASWTVAAQDLAPAPDSSPTRYEADARRLALGWMLPLMDQWSSRGLTPAPSIRHGDGRFESFSEFRRSHPSARLEAPPAISAMVDDAEPLESLSAATAQTSLDRRAGTITVTSDSGGKGRRSTVLRFDRIGDRATAKDLAHQNGQIRQLDDFIAVHFRSAVDEFGLRDIPSEIVLEQDQIRVADLVLARRRASGEWAVDVDNLRYLDDQVVPMERRRLPLGAWGPVPGDPMPGPAPTTLQKSLRLYLQLEDSAQEAAQASALRKRFPDSAVWAQIGMDGDVRVVSGGALLKHLSPSVAIKVEMGAHVRTSPDGLSREMGSYPADMLAAKVDTALRKLDLPPRVQQISLHGCALESSAFEGSYTSVFLREANGLGYLLPGAQATAYRTIVSGYGDGGTLTQRHSLDPWRWPEPGDALTFTVQRGADGSAPLGKDVVIDRREKDLDPDKTPRAWEGEPKPNGGPDQNQLLGAVEQTGLHKEVPSIDGGGWELERRARGGVDVDIDTRIDKMRLLNKDNALSALMDIGVVRSDGLLPKVDAQRLVSYIDGGDGANRAYVGRALRKMRSDAYRWLLDTAPESVRPVLTTERHRLSINQTVGRKVLARLETVDGAIDYLDTALGLYQILTNWQQMSATQKGLTVVQTGAVVISPLAMMAGQALSRLAPVARSGLLRVASAGLAGGGANVALSLLGVASCALQWKEFNAGGHSLESYAGKSLIANTVLAATSAVMAVTSAAVGTTAFLAGGAAAVAGTALSVVSSIMGGAAAPFSILMFVANAVTQAVVWFEEFGQYIREGTSVGDKAAAGFAKAFGFPTDVTLRAETEQAARQAAARLSESLRVQRQDDFKFEAKLMARQGYDTAMIPDTTHPVKHATFYDGKSSQRFNFTLQPGKPAATNFRKVTQAKGRGISPLGTAWLSMDVLESDSFVRAMTSVYPNDESRQLFQMGSLVDARVLGSRGADVFQMKKSDHVLVRGNYALDSVSSEDEIQIDAEGSDLTITPDRQIPSHRTYLSYPGLRSNDIEGIHRFVIRNAGKVVATGSGADDFYDVSSRDAVIKGGGGRNTYVVRNGNRIVVTSHDIAVWTRGVSGATLDVRSAGASLVLKVDVLHDALSFRRSGGDLDVLIGEESLRLANFFERSDKLHADGAPAAVFLDAVGTAVTLIEPEVISAQTIDVTALDKHLVFGTLLPVSRRTLSGDHARTRFHLSSGAGDFRVLPMTAMPMALFLDVPAERLVLREEGGDLLVVETPPAYAEASFTPTRLRLSGQRRSDTGPSTGAMSVWVKGKDGAPVLLALPEPGTPVDETARVAPLMASTEATSDAEKPVAAKGDLAVPGQGTDGKDVIDARGLPDGTVLRGGAGADTYRIRGGQTFVVDNSAADTALDVLEVHDIDWLELLKDVRFSGAGGDLVIGLAGGQVTVREHAARPHARHLALRVGDRQFALPVIQNGSLVHLASSTEGDVLAVSPGAHVVFPGHGDAWRLSPAARRVWMRRSAGRRDDGTRVAVVVEADHPSTVTLMDYHRAPEDWDLMEVHFREDGTRSGAVNRIRFSSPFDRSALHKALVEGDADPGTVYPQETVQDYLQSRGMPKEVARQIRGNTFQRLQRLHRLLAVAVDSRDWPLPATFIDHYTASDLTPSAVQGPMLRELVSRRSPWAYDELILRHALSMTQLQVFEAWADRHVGEARGSARACAALAAFGQMLDGQKPSGSFEPSLLAEVLALKGRPPAFAQQLALAMQAADTMDDEWAAGMLQAGVVHHDVLRRLRDAGVSPQEVVTSNANRLRYEGSGDRTALIAVNASDGLKSPVAQAYRYTLKDYLKLDPAGKRFERKDSSPQAGVVYDLVPGVIVDQHGESPEPVSTYAAWEKTYAEKIAEEQRKNESFNRDARTPSFGAPGGGSLAYASKIPEYKEALSSVVRLYRAGYADVEAYRVGGAWEGRSTPGNLFDGLEGNDEVVAWRPSDGIQINVGDFIGFDFAHPLALTSLSLSIASPPRPGRVHGAGEWGNPSMTVHAYGEQDPGDDHLPAHLRELKRWRRVSAFKVLRPGDYTAVFSIDTKGVPYSRYRLMCDGGGLPQDFWFSEATFTTVDAGASPTAVLDILSGADFGIEDIRSLFLQGLRNPKEAGRAAQLRRHFGSLDPAAVLEDARLHSDWTEAEVKLLDVLRASGDETPGWAPEALLKAVRLRAAGQHIDLLNLALPFFDAFPAGDEAHRRIHEALKEGSKDTSTDPEAMPLSWMPDWLKDIATLSSPREGAHGNAQVRLIPHDRARHLVDALHARLVASIGETEARRVTTPWYLHLAALTAAASHRDLCLRITPTGDQAIQTAVEAALSRLQAAYDKGLLKVAIATSMPPVGDVAAWSMSTQSGVTMHLSPGTDLETEYGQARDGLPIPRLEAGGFTDIEAASLFDRGVQTLAQVTRAIEWRKCFPTLSWENVAEGTLHEASLEDGQREELTAEGGEVGRGRGGFTQARLAQWVDRKLPVDAPTLFDPALPRQHVSIVQDCLDDLGSFPVNPAIAAQLTLAAGGEPGALSAAIGLAAKRQQRPHDASTVPGASSWAPPALHGFVSLEPAGKGRTTSFDAPVSNVLDAYERLLGTLDKALQEQGHAPDASAEALRSNYLELAVIRAAVGGQRLRLHMPAGESPREQAFMTLIEARLVALQEMEASGLLDVRIVSALPVDDPLQPWTTEIVDGKSWHLSPDASPAAWLRARASQVIPRLEADGFSGKDARALYALGVRTSEHVARAIDLRRHFSGLPPEVVAKDIALPPLPAEDREYAISLVRTLALGSAEVLAAVRGNKVKVLREVVVSEAHLPYSWNDLLDHAYGKWFPLVKESPVDGLLARLKTSLRTSLAHLTLDAAESSDDLAGVLLAAVSGPPGLFRASLSEVIQQLQWWHVRRDRGSDVVLSPRWAPRRLQGMVSLGDAGDAGEGGPALAAPTAIALQAFEVLLETLEEALRWRGDSEASVTKAMGPHFLRLAALHATASGRQLRLHVPATGAPADRALRDVLDRAIPFLEKARSAGLVDVAIASADLPIDRENAWDAVMVDGRVLHVSSKRPLESAWNEARRSYPFHCLTAAGYADDEAWSLRKGGVGTGDSQRQAGLLMQEMAGERTTHLGGTSVSGTQTVPSPMSLLAAHPA